MQDVQKQRNTQLTRIVDLDVIRQHNQMTLDFRATPEECLDLAKRFGILEVKDLNAYITIKTTSGSDMFKIEGDLSAEVVQECCVTLSPVEERIVDSFAEVLTTTVAALKAEEEEVVVGDEEPVELIQGDSIDIGEIVAQWLALTLNPYPRSDAPVFLHIEAANQNGEVQQKPFQVLEKLKEL
jgi:uncharacterized metal-binding protein YceD (DUF177 family)